ncbi:hypothetical protein ZWY2020_053690, partial [Hordeum vulgare]
VGGDLISAGLRPSSTKTRSRGKTVEVCGRAAVKKLSQISPKTSVYIGVRGGALPWGTRGPKGFGRRREEDSSINPSPTRIGRWIRTQSNGAQGAASAGEEECPRRRRRSHGDGGLVSFLLLRAPLVSTAPRHPRLRRVHGPLSSLPRILEAREKLSQNLQHQTKLESNEDTVALTFSNADGTVLISVEVVSVLKDQDAPGRPTALRNVDYGILEPLHLQALSKDTVSDAGAVASDKISSSVPLVLYSLCHAPSEEVQRKWPSSDLSEQSRVVIQKAHNDGCDDDGDEWLEEDTAGPGSTHIPIAKIWSSMQEHDEVWVLEIRTSSCSFGQKRRRRSRSLCRLTGAATARERANEQNCRSVRDAGDRHRRASGRPARPRKRPTGNRTGVCSRLQQFRLQIIFCLLPTLFQIREIIMHSSSRRKYDSGAFKRKKKHKLDEDAQSQYGALDKYVVKGPQTNSENQTPNANIDDG